MILLVGGGGAVNGVDSRATPTEKSFLFWVGGGAVVFGPTDRGLHCAYDGALDAEKAGTLLHALTSFDHGAPAPHWPTPGINKWGVRITLISTVG